jgi:hypothetical protein
MDPYYANQQTFGPAQNGINRNGIQLYGAPSQLGAFTASSIGLGAVLGAGIIVMYAVPTVISVLVQNKVLGFDNRLSTKSMTKRAALMGGLFGIPVALIVAGSTAASGK